ncbi:hypothetical protein JE943_000963 [Flavobacterium psychrophilum]|nr:hypothetical protein [Flavobacterium psychrophilum]
MEFKASEIDLVLQKLIECDKPYYHDEFQKLYFNDWQVLKIKAIFKYLAETHKGMFDDARYSDIYDMYFLYIGNETKEMWQNELEKGGFTTFWKKKEDFKTTLKNTLSGANISLSLMKSVLSVVDSFI